MKKMGTNRNYSVYSSYTVYIYIYIYIYQEPMKKQRAGARATPTLLIELPVKFCCQHLSILLLFLDKYTWSHAMWHDRSLHVLCVQQCWWTVEEKKQSQSKKSIKFLVIERKKLVAGVKNEEYKEIMEEAFIWFIHDHQFKYYSAKFLRLFMHVPQLHMCMNMGVAN